MTSRPGRLSKSRYLTGRQCLRRLWLAVNGDSPEPSIESEDNWELRRLEGAAVEKLVEERFANAIHIVPGHGGAEMDDAPPDNAIGVDRTLDALSESQPIFQAYLQTDDVLAIADILEPRQGGWYMWEVKASTSAVAIHDHDLAFQVETARRVGVRIVGAGLWLLNKGYLRGQSLDADALLQPVDRTEQVFALAGDTRAEVERQLAVLREHDVPEVTPGPRCKGNRKGPAGDRPSTCGHLGADGYCGRTLPEHWIGQLPRLALKRADALAGLTPPSVEQLDPDAADMKWTKPQQRMIRAVRAGEPLIDKPALRKELDKLEWPVAYVDFEFDPGMGIPRFRNARPYERMPFQWSMHRQETPGAPLGNPESFLWLESSDPRQPFADSLLAALPASGSIVVHSKAAEKTVLKQLAAALGEDYKERIEPLIERLFDTQDLLQAGYYHPDQKGSYSIKKVAPALLGRGYEDLAMQDGMAAVVGWREAIDARTVETTKKRIADALLAYCGRDTELMHDIVERIRAQV